MDIATALDSPDLARFRRKVTLLSAVGMFLDGFDLTVIAVAVPVLRKHWTFNGFTLGLTNSSAIIGMFVGALVLGRLADRIGRRRMYTINLIGFTVFAGLTALSQNVWQLIILRFLLGLWIGADYPISSSLTAEFSSRGDRGRLVVALSLMWNVGALFAYVAGIVLLPVGANAWRWMLLIGAVIAFVAMLFRTTVPESPRWLASHGRPDEARAVVARLVGEDSLDELPPEPPKERWQRLFSRGLIGSTVFICVFWFAHGIAYYGIQLYSPTILSEFASGSQRAAYIGSSVIAALGVLGAAVGLMFVDSWGRRPVIITAFAGEFTVPVILALLHAPPLSMIVTLFAIAILFSNMGPGTLDMVYCTELYPTGLRAAGTGLGTAVSRLGAILGVLVFPDLVSAWGVSRAMWIFVAAAVLGLTISVTMAPETRNRSLEQTSSTDPETSRTGRFAKSTERQPT